MYRYVFKRVKETFDFGVNARKSYAWQQASSSKCKTQNETNISNQQPQQQHQRHIVEINFLTPIEHQQRRYEDFKRKYNCKHPYSCNPFLQAITWSTALIAGFYASQLLCLYRRNHRLNDLGKKCFYSRYLDQKNRFLQNKLFCSHYARQKYNQQKQQQRHQRSLVTSSKFKCPLKQLFARESSSSEKRSDGDQKREKDKLVVVEEEQDFQRNFGSLGLFDKRFETFYDTHFGDSTTYRRVYVNNNSSGSSHKSTETLVESKEGKENDVEETSSEREERELNALLTSLTDMIGEMEFQMGVESIMSGRYSDAVEHFRMAASSNHVNSLFNLALLYEQGLGVKKDKKVAYKLYDYAGQLGHDKALFNQGVFHVKGLGGAKKSFKLARKYFEKSAALGNSDAIEALSMLLPDYHQKTLVREPDDFIVADDVSKSSLTLEPASVPSSIRSIART